MCQYDDDDNAPDQMVLRECERASGCMSRLDEA